VTRQPDIFLKSSQKLVTIPEKAHQHYQTFLKMFNKVTGLIKKSSSELPVFSKKDRIASGEFREKTGPVRI